MKLTFNIDLPEVSSTAELEAALARLADLAAAGAMLMSQEGQEASTGARILSEAAKSLTGLQGNTTSAQRRAVFMGYANALLEEYIWAPLMRSYASRPKPESAAQSPG